MTQQTLTTQIQSKQIKIDISKEPMSESSQPKQYSIDVNRQDWSKKVDKCYMHTIPAEEEALPFLIELAEILQKILQHQRTCKQKKQRASLYDLMSESDTEYLLTYIIPQICQKIIKSRYFKNEHVLFNSNLILERSVYLFIQYLKFLVETQKLIIYVDIIIHILSTDQYYYKTNNQLSEHANVFNYFKKHKYSSSCLTVTPTPAYIHKQQIWRDQLKVGDYIDIVKYDNTYGCKATWSQGIIQKMQNDGKIIKVSYLYDGDAENNKPVIMDKDSIQIAPFETKSLRTFNWRYNLKSGDVVDCQDNYGGWYNSTILEVIQKLDQKRSAVVTFKIYHQNGNKVDQKGNFYGFTDHRQTIDLTSPKIQPFCSILKAKNYDASGKYIYESDDLNDLQVDEINGQKMYALPRKKYLSQVLFNIINQFGRKGGFDYPLQILENTVNYNLLCGYVKGISGVAAYLHRGIVTQLVERLQPIIQKHIFLENDQHLKQFTKQRSEMLFSGYKILQRRILSIEAAYEYENSKKMTIVSRCLQSQSLKRKLQGLNELKDIVRSLTHSNDRNKQIKGWIKEQGIFEKIYLLNSHVQLIKKSQDFFRYVINESILQVEDLKKLYKIAQKSDYQSRISLYKLFQEVSHIFKKPHVDFIIDTILESELHLILNQDIDLLHEMSKFSNYFPKQKVITFFENIILGPCQLPELNQYAIKKYSEIVSKGYQMKSHKREIIKRFILRVEGKSLHQLKDNTEQNKEVTENNREENIEETAEREKYNSESNKRQQENKQNSKDLFRNSINNNISQICKVLKGIFQGIAVGQWGRRDLNEILEEENLDEVCLRALKSKNYSKEEDYDRVFTEILKFLLFLYKISNKTKIQITTLKGIWKLLNEKYQFSQLNEKIETQKQNRIIQKYMQFYRWCNEAICLEQGLSGEFQYNQFEQFYLSIYSHITSPSKQKSRLNEKALSSFQEMKILEFILFKNLFISINVKYNLITVSNISSSPHSCINKDQHFSGSASNNSTPLSKHKQSSQSKPSKDSNNKSSKDGKNNQNGCNSRINSLISIYQNGNVEYYRKAEMKELKLEKYLLESIYAIQSKNIYPYAIMFYEQLYHGKDTNNQEEIQELYQYLIKLITQNYHFIQQLTKSITQTNINTATDSQSQILSENDEKIQLCQSNLQKSLILLNVIIDESEKKVEPEVLKLQCLKSKKVSSKIKISIYNDLSYFSENSKKSEFSLDSSCTLLQLRKILGKHYSYSWQQLKLTHKRQLAFYLNCKTLEEVGIANGDLITLNRRHIPYQQEGEIMVNNAMNIKAVRAFKVIFEKYSNNGLMSKDQCNDFTAVCLGTLSKRYDSKITEVYQKYDLDHDNYLTFENFITFYQDSARERSSTVWSNLKSFGVSGDFKFPEEVSKDVDISKLPRIKMASNAELYSILFSLLNEKCLAGLSFSILERLPVPNNIYQQYLGFYQIKQQQIEIKQEQRQKYKQIQIQPEQETQQQKQQEIKQKPEQIQNLSQILVQKIISSENNNKYITYYKLILIKSLTSSATQNRCEQQWLIKFIKVNGMQHLYNYLKNLLLNKTTATTVTADENIIENANLQHEQFVQYEIIHLCIDILSRFWSKIFYDVKLEQAKILLESQLNIDHKIQYLILGILPSTLSLNPNEDLAELKIFHQNKNKYSTHQEEIKLQSQIRKDNQQCLNEKRLKLWNGDEKVQILGIFLKYLEELWAMKAQTASKALQIYHKDQEELFNKLISSILILLINENPTTFCEKLATFFQHQVSNEKFLLKLYELILCVSFYSIEKHQNVIINTMFKYITLKNITSQYFRVLAVLVSKFGLEQENICEMPEVLMQNIIQQQNQLTIEGCAKLLSNFQLKSLIKQKDIENIWGHNLFGDAVQSCKKEPTRTALYQLLIKICEKSPEDTNYLLERIKETLKKKISLIKVTYSSEVNQRSVSTGYSGLKNLGNICYMNSMLQQLFMNKSFRYLLLRIDDKKQPEFVLDSKENQVDDNFLHQIQRIFAYLERTTRVDFIPSAFCIAYKPFGESVNIMMQQDVQEFVSMFFDRLQQGIKDHPLKKLIENFYAGKYTNLFNCHQCKQTKKVEENFYSLTLEVKNSKSLIDSFNRFILGEMISDYKCDFCGKKADVSKKTRISKAPKILILHLQRIVFNLDTFINEKITTKHEFPQEFNLNPYTLDFYQKQIDSKDNKEKEKSLSNSEQQPNNNANSSGKPVEAGELKYKLSGIICHIGNAEQGHYISYVKTPNDQSNSELSSKWIEINDSLVSTFNQKNIDHECFGGNVMFEDQYDWEKRQNSKSAYLLIYQKEEENAIELVLTADQQQQKQQLLKQLVLEEYPLLQNNSTAQREIKSEEPTESQEESSSMLEDSEKEKQEKYKKQFQEVQIIKKQKSQDREDNVMKEKTQNIKAQQDKICNNEKSTEITIRVKNEITSYISPALQKQIEADNEVHFFERCLASPSFSKFFANVLSLSEIKNQQTISLCEKLTFGFWLKSSNFKDLLAALSTYLQKYPEQFPKFYIKNEGLLFNLLIENAEVEVRSNITTFLSKNLSNYIESIPIDNLTTSEEEMTSIQSSLLKLFKLLPTTVSKCWTKFTHYFQFWHDLAKASKRCLKFMMEHEFVKHLVDYFLDKKSPLKIYINKPVIGSTYAQPNFTMLLKTIEVLILGYAHHNQQFTEEEKIVLLHFDFIDKLIIERHQLIAASIVKNICPRNLHASEKIAIVLLKGLERANYQNVQPYLQVLHELVLLADEYQILRMQWVLGKAQLNLTSISKTIAAMNGSSLEERLYYFDVGLHVEQGSGLLQPIFLLNKKTQNFCMLSLQEILKLCKESSFVRNYIWSLPPPNYMFSKYVDFFDEFITRYVDDARRIFGYGSSSWFNKEQLGKNVKKLYQEVLTLQKADQIQKENQFLKIQPSQTFNQEKQSNHVQINSENNNEKSQSDKQYEIQYPSKQIQSEQQSIESPSKDNNQNDMQQRQKVKGSVVSAMAEQQRIEHEMIRQKIEQTKNEKVPTLAPYYESLNLQGDHGASYNKEQNEERKNGEKDGVNIRRPVVIVPSLQVHQLEHQSYIDISLPYDKFTNKPYPSLSFNPDQYKEEIFSGYFQDQEQAIKSLLEKHQSKDSQQSKDSSQGVYQQINNQIRLNLDNKKSEDLNFSEEENIQKIIKEDEETKDQVKNKDKAQNKEKDQNKEKIQKSEQIQKREEVILEEGEIYEININGQNSSQRQQSISNKISQNSYKVKDQDYSEQIQMIDMSSPIKNIEQIGFPEVSKYHTQNNNNKKLNFEENTARYQEDSGSASAGEDRDEEDLLLPSNQSQYKRKRYVQNPPVLDLINLNAGAKAQSRGNRSKNRNNRVVIIDEQKDGQKQEHEASLKQEEYEGLRAWHPVKLNYKVIEELECEISGVKIQQHESELILLKTKPTFLTNKSFSPSYAGRRVSERLLESAWEHQKVETVTGYFIENNSKNNIRVQTSDGVCYIRSTDSKWIWSDQIFRIWVSEKSSDWPKWTLYPESQIIQEQEQEPQKEQSTPKRNKPLKSSDEDEDWSAN